MVRTRFEVLEKRQMFAASSLSDAVEAYVLMNCPNDVMARPEEVIPAEAIAGDFNNDGTDDLAGVKTHRAMLLPYVEQDNVYKAQASDAPPGRCAAVLVADIADGTSNTIMFSGANSDDRAGERSFVDIWEHAFADRAGANANGIIAILIGLTADPAGPSGDAPRGANALFGDGSVRFLSLETSEMVDLQKVLTASDEYFALLSNKGSMITRRSS